MANEHRFNDMMGMQEQAVERARQMQRMEQRAAQRAKEDFSRKMQPEQSGNPAPGMEQPARQAAAQPKRTPMPVDYLHNGHPQAQQHTARPPATQHTPPVSKPQEQREAREPHPPVAQHTILGGDNDSAMLLALILLLSRESADPHLMLALMYIMM